MKHHALYSLLIGWSRRQTRVQFVRVKGFGRHHTKCSTKVKYTKCSTKVWLLFQSEGLVSWQIYSRCRPI